MTASMPADIGWIQTASGGRFYPLAPRVEDVKIEDIAAALSRNCRFTGHCSHFYSVAEHSVRVVDFLAEDTQDPEVLMWGLLHDASEAYIADIARPLKQQPEFAFYRSMEKSVMDVITLAFRLPPLEPPIVKAADTQCLALEAEELMPHREKDQWAWMPPARWPKQSMFDPRRGLGLAPDLAESAFMIAFNHLERLRV